MENILKSLIKIGRVSSVNPNTATARVLFEAQGLVSHDLPVLQRQTLRNKDYWLPDVGEYVVCIFLPTGNADGFILGSIYSDDDQLPASSKDKRVILFEDGTKLEYDRASHTLTINAVGPINIVASGNINVTGDVIADGISLKNHVHPENDLGGPTGPPL
ncbi:phage baseplate assembly protein V [Carboxydothermus pertinax]|uniref:Baseplate assembly protein n=1 Tax=Carboxydothermus pertinax TaxID=870242 RepID=A0A1L8CRR5_9THEO|nr:phage baseplate assembly protein V [Carboxydothermus pertinax]GAV21616.1 baseplate assembly protein [Carboxydothermus pertinax]